MFYQMKYHIQHHLVIFLSSIIVNLSQSILSTVTAILFSNFYVPASIFYATITMYSTVYRTSMYTFFQEHYPFSLFQQLLSII